MRLLDMSAAQSGDERSAQATPAAANRSLEEHGLVIIREAFAPDLIGGLLAAAASHLRQVEDAVQAGRELQFPEHFRWLGRSLACELAALDPATAGNFQDFSETTLCAAIMSSFVQSILRAVMGGDVGVALVRARVLIPGAGEGRPNGLLALHMEKTSIAFPGVHNIWTPLTSITVETNSDAPGLQFLLGALDFFETASEGEAADYLRSVSHQANQEKPETMERGFIYRPKMRTGDLAIFNGSLPHGGYIPRTAHQSRVSCDVRLFPWTETNHLPSEAIRAGQSHRRLAWPASLL